MTAGTARPRPPAEIALLNRQNFFMNCNRIAMYTEGVNVFEGLREAFFTSLNLLADSKVPKLFGSLFPTVYFACYASMLNLKLPQFALDAQ